jgi:RNA polymerase sigma-70 factor (ECF subfamily)
MRERSRSVHDIAVRAGGFPPASVLRAEVRRILERRIDELPVPLLTFFMMREVAEMSMAETAESLSIPVATCEVA